jgi:hypothetical protein
VRGRFRQLAPWAVALGLNLLLFVPARACGAGRLGISFEYGLGLLLVGLAARGRLRVLARGLLVAGYLSLLLFLVYHHGFRAFFARAPALVEDWRLALNLMHFLGEMRTVGWIALWSGALGGLVALGILVERSSAAIGRRLGTLSSRALAGTLSLWLIAGAATLAWGRPLGLPSRVVADNYRTSRQVAARLALIRGAPPDRRYASLEAVRLERRPSVYLLMIEAYGEVLATWDMKDAYRALLARVEARLGAAGYHARTAYSAAPVYGGRSWFSIATVHTGILIDQPAAYDALGSVAGAIPTLTRFFRQQGYRTMTLQPGTTERAGLNPLDLYQHALVVDAPAIGYRGARWGFGGIPDQYSLGSFRARHLAGASGPQYLFYMAVSTHFPWSHLPPYVAAWRTLDEQPTPAALADPRWPPLPGTEKIASDFRLAYLSSVEYEWRVLLDLLEAERGKDLVVIVLGDHQPRLESNPPGEVTFHAPVHVLGSDPAFVARFAPEGFEPGLYAEPGRRPPLVHEGLFSLVVTKLAESYGSAATRANARYFPDGISLAGLNP